MMNRRHFLQALSGGAAALVVPSKLVMVFGDGVHRKPPWVERVTINGKVYTRGASGLMAVDYDRLSEKWHAMKEAQPRFLRNMELQNKILREAYAQSHGADALAEAMREAVGGSRAVFEAHRRDLAKLMTPGMTMPTRRWFSLQPK